ncbi:hypothetical protein QQF64_012042 [Cirrhinus molitorella]|uniref:Uncharacterized protein n=1 Tax=Cirrhinus molitorella TaxID=172907 RepID=A0ABR3LXZ2_9TELE
MHELLHRKGRENDNEKCKEKVNASHSITNLSDVCVSKHAPPPYHHYPVAEMQALKADPDLDCSPPRRPTATARNSSTANRAASGRGSIEKWPDMTEEDPDVIPETTGRQQ